MESRFQQGYTRDDLQIFGIMAWSVANVSDETIVSFADQTGVSFPVMRDSDATYFEYDVVQESAPFPLDVLVDKTGTVRYVSERFDAGELDSVIQQLLVE